MRIAIAATGLDHIKRGVESWAASLAGALAERGCDVTLFKSTGEPRPREHILNGLPRHSVWNARLLRVTSRLGGWRYGLGDDYGIEQLSAVVSLLWRLKCRRYDIVHTQDALLARLLQRSADAGLHSSKVILANGTGEPVTLLTQLPYVQELSPSYFAEHIEKRDSSGVFLVPNFVDVTQFAPADRSRARRHLGLPDDARIVLSVGAIKGPRKRMDWLIREFSRLNIDAMLVIAGAVERETDTLIQWAKDVLGRRLVILADREHHDMPAVYQAADVFALCAIDEVFGIAFLEAMAVGIPCIGHRYPVTEWVLGPGGITRDMRREGDLAEALQRLLTDDTTRRELGCAARRRVCEAFSTDVVVAETLNMYRAVTSPQHAKSRSGAADSSRDAGSDGAVDAQRAIGVRVP